MPRPGACPRFYPWETSMKKQMKKLALAKETLRGLEKRDGLGHVAGGTVDSGCTACDPSDGSCCSCYNGCVDAPIG
jgi:hypothetical protein